MKTAVIAVLVLFGPLLGFVAWITFMPEEWPHALGRGVLAVNNVLGLGVWVYGGFYLVNVWARKREGRDCEHLQTVTRCERCGRVVLGHFQR